jgi:hypothetical protein
MEPQPQDSDGLKSFATLFASHPKHSSFFGVGFFFATLDFIGV